MTFCFCWAHSCQLKIFSLMVSLYTGKSGTYTSVFWLVSQRAEAKHLTELCSHLAATRAFSSWKVSQLTEAKHFLAEAETIRRFRFCGKRNQNVRGLNGCSEGQLSAQDRSFVAGQPSDRIIRGAANRRNQTRERRKSPPRRLTR